MATTTEASAEEDYPNVLTITIEASIEEAEDTARLSERLRRVKVYDYGGDSVLLVILRSQQQQQRRQLRKHKTCSSSRCPVRSHSLVCSENPFSIVGIGPIPVKEL